MSKYFLSAALAAAALAFCFAANVQATVVCDFESGANSYDNTHGTQTTGLFRDNRDYYDGTSPEPSSYIDISENGTANDYLVLRAIWGSPASGTFYDTTPNAGSPYSVFKTPVGATTTVSADVTFDNWSTTNAYSLIGVLNIIDPLADGSGSNRGFTFEYINRSSTTLDSIRSCYLSSENSYTNPTRYLKSAVDTDYALDQQIVRLSVDFLNNGTSATITFRIDKLDALEGFVISNVWTGTPTTIDYGTSSTQLDMDPVNHGFEIGLSRNVIPKANGGGLPDSARVYMDYLTVTTVPEPSTFALLAAGLVGLLAYAWRKRR